MGTLHLTKKFGFAPAGKYGPRWAYRAWQTYSNQQTRCRNPKSSMYYKYGKAGISVEYTFADFLEWYKKNCPNLRKRWVIGRKDHRKSYSLSNIQFETATESSKERIRRLGPPTPRIGVVVKNYSGRVVGQYPSLLDAQSGVGLDRKQIRHYMTKKIPHPKLKLFFEGA